jgi:hypothetical protein
MRTRSFSEPEVLVSGRRFAVSLVASIGAATGVGILSYYGLIRTMGSALGSATPQIVTLAVLLGLLLHLSLTGAFFAARGDDAFYS